MKKPFIIIALLIVIAIVSTWYLLSDADKPIPLTRYICIADRINLSGLESSRTFDTAGIILSKERYHPLSIAQYGMLSYYNFLDTQDSSFYRKVVNQSKYFKDTTKVNYLFEGKGIGLPYNYNLWDLKSPWYSGMTQGYAVSFLLRYSSLTGDTSVIPIIEKIAYLLVKDQSEGGTLSITNEGCLWIEEYPNSKTSPQVLNGAINGLIGLKEYCDYFPSDTKARQVLDEVYEGIKYSMELYDSPNWSYYNRKNKSIGNNYLRYQIYEMEQLYGIFRDEIFANQKRIWAVLIHNKFINDNTTKYKYKNHNMSEPATQITEGRFGIPLKKIN